VTFPIVAIGASAGGLEALTELLAALPSKSGLAYIAVQHLDPDHKSLLAEILTKKTSQAVMPAQDGLAIEPDRVYVIPPNTTLTVMDGHLRVVPRAGGLHHPADILFTSLAEERADRAIGVVLSGGDGDGALGIQAIKQAGGITFAQEPSSAKFPSMPKHAIETGCVDFVLRPDQIAHELTRLSQHPYLRATPAPILAPAEPGQGPSATEEESLKLIFRRLRSVHGVDFAHYKRSTLRRRLERRMALQKTETLADYVALIDTDVAEAAALYQDFLIRVTTFFRDPESFEGLAQRVFPSLCEGRSPKTPIRIWIPGCASGEEVYSIAMTLLESLVDRRPAGIQIFGTDVSEAAIDKARAGIYLESIAQEVSSERLQRFFVKQNDHYRIAKSIRDLCIFARHDVTRDPPFSRLDLVSCRNLLIYLDAAAQRRVMQVFHYALRPEGFLLLGPSESVGQASNLFELADKHHRLYTRSPASPGVALDLAQQGAAPNIRPGDVATGGTEIPLEADSLQREADRLLLTRFAPASLVVDEALNILRFRGETGPYLEHASGVPSLHLHRVARPELLVELGPALQEARESGVPVRREGLRLDERRDVVIEVMPLKRLGTQGGYLILLEDDSRGGSRRRRQQAAASVLPESEKDRRLGQMEREIAAMRDYWQANMEEHEAVKEELKSAHEEVLSASEEFQSTNEELETAKEELQSANEELTTTNDELRNRNRELGELNAEVQHSRETAEYARDFADTIIETVLEPLLVLDGKLKIVRTNSAFYADFNTRAEETEDRLLYDLGDGQWDVPTLRAGLAGVLIHNESLVDFEVDHSFPGIGERTMRLNARKIRSHGGRPELILLAMADVTARKARADRLAQDVQRKDEFLAMLAHELRNPLAPIRHAVQLLRRGDGDASAPQLYDMIERQTRRLVRLVDELLDVARISRGFIELKRGPVDLGSVVQHTVAASRPHIEQRRQELSLTLPEVPVWVDGDPVRLEQIMSNLLDNAAKYTASGGRIAVKLTQNNGEALLSVRDNGIGLAPDTRESIFDLFSQVDRSLAHSGGGLGIGLTLVRRVLELHGGRIEARSGGLGQGSEFIVRLPVLVPSVVALYSASGSETQSRVPNARARRVLIIEDNADSADALALLVRSLGHESAVARDGPTALAIAERFRPDIALVDIGLPGMDGYELARLLRADPRYAQLYLVAMTGYGREEDRSAARAAGFDVHLVKPAEIDDLQALLANGAAKPGG
jgi:two-component system CheB/CheR fusion protein